MHILITQTLTGGLLHVRHSSRFYRYNSELNKYIALMKHPPPNLGMGDGIGVGKNGH